jgi:hypothetical protein
MPGIRDKARSLTGVKARTAIRGKKITWPAARSFLARRLKKARELTVAKCEPFHGRCDGIAGSSYGLKIVL